MRRAKDEQLSLAIVEGEGVLHHPGLDKSKEIIDGAAVVGVITRQFKDKLGVISVVCVTNSQAVKKIKEGASVKIIQGGGETGALWDATGQGGWGAELEPE